MARPKLPEGEQQEEDVWTRVTREMKDKFYAACKLEGLSTAASIRTHIHNLVYKWEKEDPEKLAQALAEYRRKRAAKTRAK